MKAKLLLQLVTMVLPLLAFQLQSAAQALPSIEKQVERLQNEVPELRSLSAEQHKQLRLIVACTYSEVSTSELQREAVSLFDLNKANDAHLLLVTLGSSNGLSGACRILQVLNEKALPWLADNYMRADSTQCRSMITVLGQIHYIESMEILMLLLNDKRILKNQFAKGDPGIVLRACDLAYISISVGFLYRYCGSDRPCREVMTNSTTSEENDRMIAQLRAYLLSRERSDKCPGIVKIPYAAPLLGDKDRETLKRGIARIEKLVSGCAPAH